jgi:hypothetical protein
MTHDEILEKLKQLQAILLHRISDEGHDNPNIHSDTYRELREALTSIVEIQPALPHFVKEYFDLRSFWRFIRRHEKTPEERQTYINRAFDRTYTMLQR